MHSSANRYHGAIRQFFNAQQILTHEHHRRVELKILIALLAEAERLAAGDTGKIRRIALIRGGFRCTKDWTQMRHFAAQKDIPRMRAAGAEALKRLDETADTEPQAIWIWLAKSQTEAMMRELETEIEAGKE